MTTPPTPPLPPPIPVQPLGYVQPPTYGRPAILTAVAVLSIIVASFSLLFSGGIGLYGGIMIVASQLARSTTVTTTPPPATVVAPPQQGTPTGEVTDDDDAMPKPGRTVVVGALANLRPLSDVRQKHLDALLAKAGKKILPLSGDALTPRAVQANVTDAGQFPSGTGKPSAGANYFAVALGRIEVDDRHAVFYPLGAGEVVRASASPDDEAPADAPESPGAIAATPRVARLPQVPKQSLSDADVRQVIATLETRSGHKLNATQARVLRQQLEDPGQSLFIPNVPVASQIRRTSWAGNNTAGTNVVTLSTRTGSITLPSNGGASVSSGAFVSAGTGVPRVTWQAASVLVSSLISLALAVLLLVAAIATLRDSRAARRLHLIYACAKLPVVALAAIAWGWMWYVVMSGLPSTGTSPPRVISLVVVIPMLVGMIYPVALLIVMHTRTVRAYYSPVTSH